jgi:arabinogalactan endo-1,4-beta-galactosidase
MVYDLSRKGYSWEDETSKSYTNAFNLFHDKGVDWFRVMLFWNETEDKKSGAGEYTNTLDYVTNALLSAHDAGLRLAVILSLEDGGCNIGCINLNPITLPSRYNSDGTCHKFSDLSNNEKLSVIEEYAENVDKYFTSKGINVELYEIGNEIDHGYAGTCDDTHDTDVNWYKTNIWSYEADAMKAAIRGIKKSNPTALIETHLAMWWESDWVYNFFKFMLDKGVSLNYGALSYYPTSFSSAWGWKQDVYQNIGCLLSNIDNVYQKLSNDGYNLKFIIAEYAYSSSELQGLFKDNFNNQNYFKYLFMIQCYH